MLVHFTIVRISNLVNISNRYRHCKLHSFPRNRSCRSFTPLKVLEKYARISAHIWLDLVLFHHRAPSFRISAPVIRALLCPDVPCISQTRVEVDTGMGVTKCASFQGGEVFSAPVAQLVDTLEGQTSLLVVPDVCELVL